MKIIGCDFHPGYQQIAMLDLVTGEMVEKAALGASSLCPEEEQRTIHKEEV